MERGWRRGDRRLNAGFCFPVGRSQVVRHRILISTGAMPDGSASSQKMADLLGIFALTVRLGLF
jgi:hypothetical protein